MIETPYSGVIKDISIIIWPERAEKRNRRNELGVVWESEFGFLRGNSFAVLSTRHFTVLSPASFSPAKSPAKGTEQ